MYNEITAARLPTSLLIRARMSAGSIRASTAWDPHHISHPGVARCVQFLGRKRQVQFKLRDLQRVAGLSRRGLHKAFMTHLGCSPGVLLRRARLVRACDLLANSSLSVDEIARRCGYRSANSLWVAFARDLGVSPVRFRFQRQTEPAGNIPLSNLIQTPGRRATRLDKDSQADPVAPPRHEQNNRSLGNRRLTPCPMATKLVER